MSVATKVSQGLLPCFCQFGCHHKCYFKQNKPLIWPRTWLSCENWIKSPWSWSTCVEGTQHKQLLNDTSVLKGNSECLRLPRGRSGKEPTCQCRRHRRHWFNPWVRKIPWRRKWQPTLVFLSGKSHGQRTLAGHSFKESQRAGHNWECMYAHMHCLGMHARKSVVWSECLCHLRNCKRSISNWNFRPGVSSRLSLKCWAILGR